MGGAILAVFIINEVDPTQATEPIEQFVRSYELFIPNAFLALAVATFLVVLSQVKINVTNAYSGSLSWSNFFSRIFHWHPGRVVWVIFNVGIALALMLGGVFGFLNFVLGFYSNVAIAWIGAVVADLVINKPFLRVSPSYIEFKRAHLYQINPVGFVSMIVASAVSIPAFFGLFGELARAFSPYLALVIAFVFSPALAFLTKGKYYVAREGSSSEFLENGDERYRLRECVQCGQEYETPEMSFCPFHEGDICTLCSTLDRDCHDMCKKAGLNGKAPQHTCSEAL